jgi:hypothetical protein
MHGYCLLASMRATKLAIAPSNQVCSCSFVMRNVYRTVTSRRPPESDSDSLGRWRRSVGCNPLLARIGHTIEEIYDSGLQCVLGPYDEEPILVDQLLEDYRSVPQMVSRGNDVGPNGLPQKSIRHVLEFCRQQRFYGRPDAVND